MRPEDIVTRIGITHRTPIIAMFRMKHGWRVWTAVRDPKAAYSQWEGTYFEFRDDGSCVRNTVFEDGSEDEQEIKPKDR